MKILRAISQGVFLLLFLFLFIRTESVGGDELGYPVKIFLDIDPLLFISTLLSSHELTPFFYLSLIVAGITVLLGRVFCGWVCPFGTMHTIVSIFGKTAMTGYRNLYRMKYYILVFLIAASVFGVQITGFMDPMSLLVRSMTIGIYPAFHFGITSLFDTLHGMQLALVTDASEYVLTILKSTLLSFQQPLFLQGFFVGVLFVALLLLNLIQKRFWCRYLCPLGALLGLLSRYAVVSHTVSEGCTGCGVCNEKCSGGAIGENPGELMKSECLYCMECDDACPVGAVKFAHTFGKGYPSPDLSRRGLLFAAASGIITVPLLKVSPASGRSYYNATLIRPPGAVEETEFIKKCVRCGECMKVCITNGLQPALWQAGPEGLWTPYLVPRIGYCEYRCTLCGQVCPTGAIKRLTTREKAATKIGLAVIDQGRCLPYAFDTPCIACEEVCPTPEKAIQLEEVTVKGHDGFERSLKRPRVDPHLCVGCGTCESVCPVVGKPAIYVINTGETRSSDNRIIL